MTDPVQQELTARRRAASLKERALMAAYFGLARVIPDALIRAVVARMGRKRPEDIGVDRVNERIARDLPPQPQGRVVWLHSIGPGDSTALLPLIPELLAQGVHCVVTTRTFAAQKVFAKLAEGGQVTVQLAPYDTYPVMRRFLDHWQPDTAIFCERDLWPVALHLLKKRGARVGIVNGQMDGRLGDDLRKLPGLGRWMMGHIDVMHVFSDACAADARTWLRADAQVLTLPNLKLDAAPLAAKPDLLAQLRAVWAGRLVVTAASVRSVEVPVLLEALDIARATRPELRLILAPRWKEQLAELQEMVAAPCRSIDGLPGADDAVFIADSYGELGTWFEDSVAVFMGDTLFYGWGHNPYEPVLKGCEVIAGSHSRLFGADFRYLEGLGLCVIAPDAAAIAREILRLADQTGQSNGFARLWATRGFTPALAQALLHG